MPGAIATIPKYQFSDSVGAPLAGGTLTTYTAGTTTLAGTWQDQALSVANTNPITLDSRGECVLWLNQAASYKLVLKNSAGVTQWTVDNVSGADAGLRAALAASSGSSLVGYLPSGTGAVATAVQAKLRESVSVADFMSTAQRADYIARTLSLDLTTALVTAIAAAKAAGAKLVATPGSARITSTVTIDCDADLKAMTISCNASTMPGPAVCIGTTANYVFNLDVVLPFVTNSAKSGVGWTGFPDKIGVEIANAYHCRVTVPSVVGFGVGLTMGGYGKGCVYNTIYIGILSQNKIQHQLLPKTTDGWCNQNLFIGGRFFFDSAEGVNVSGTKMIHLAAQAAATVGPPDSNTWINTTIEDDTPEFYLDVQGAWNRWENVRFETSAARGAPDVRFYSEVSGQTTSNYIVGGYDTRGFDFTFAGLSSPYNARVDSRENNAIEVAGCGWSIANRSGSTISSPHFQGFAGGTTPLGKTSTATDWRYRLYADGLAMKASADTEARIVMEGGSGRIYFGFGNAAPTAYFGPGIGAEVQVNGAFYPSTDNARTLGLSSNRWSVVYAGTGAINTSDAREKQQVRELAASERAVAVRCKALIRAFKFNDAVSLKGQGARIHVGVVAQDVIAAFAAEGLDAAHYALLCYDEWEAEFTANGTEIRPAGNRYGVRYEELLAFMLSVL